LLFLRKFWFKNGRVWQAKSDSLKTVGFEAEKVRFPDLLLEKRTGFSRYLIEIAFSDIFIRKPPEADLLIRVFRALKRVTRVNRPATGFFRIYKSGRAM